MDPKMKEAFENIKFYKFYPVKTPDTPDVNNVKVCSASVKHSSVKAQLNRFNFVPIVFCRLGTSTDTTEMPII
jgi:hypothetical protein